MQYIKDRSYYEDQYDLHTIEECLDWYWSIRKKFEANRKHKDFKKYSDKKFDKEVHKVCSYTVNVIKAERFRKRKDRIQEWMDRDQKTQDIFDNAKEPDGIKCRVCCYSSVKLISKDFMNAYDDDAYVLFMFECVKCKKRRAVYEDGREWHSDPPTCPKCQGDLISDIKLRKKNVLVFAYSCKKCGYKREDVEDFEKSRKETEAKEARDRKLLKEYREEFCYSEKDGLSAIQSLDGSKAFMDEMKATKKKESDPVYKKVMSDPELLKEQAEKWKNKKQDSIKSHSSSIADLKSELEAIKKEEQRYIKAYGSEMISMEQLEAAMKDLKMRRVVVEKQISGTAREVDRTDVIIPSQGELEDFCTEAASHLSNVSFESKQAIVREVVDNIVATQEKLRVVGYLPLSKGFNYVKYKTISRHSRITKCGKEYIV